MQSLILLCDITTFHVGAIKRHVDAFKQYSDIRVEIIDLQSLSPENIELFQNSCLIFHFSLDFHKLHHILTGEQIKAISNNRCTKAAFVQDEYRNINQVCETLVAFGIDTLFTVAPLEIAQKIYAHSDLEHLTLHTVLTGYVSQDLLGQSLPKAAERPIDISYRARKSSYALGYAAYEKWLIGESVADLGDKAGLKTDISSDTRQRFSGDDWLTFLKASKACLGTDSGASVMDFDGRLQLEVDAYCAKHPTASFEQVRSQFFADQDGLISIQVISPRIFEAAAMRTLLILYPGQYSGRLIPGRHYLVLNKDHSNFSDIVTFLRDPDKVDAMTKLTYEEVACSYENSYEAAVQQVLSALPSSIVPASLIDQTHSEQLDRIAKQNQQAASGRLKSTRRILLALTANRKIDSSIARLPSPIAKGLQMLKSLALTLLRLSR